MKYKKIGKDGGSVSVIGQGCMGIGGYLSEDLSQDDKHVYALKSGIDNNMTFIDTAEVYGNGHSEELVARAVEGVRDKVFIATKVSPENLSYDAVIRSAERSLQRLKTDYIDLYQIHWPNPKIPVSETMRAMEQLVNEGKIRFIGVSNFSLKELKEEAKCLPKHPIVSTQTEYNLFDRTIENDILPYCEKKGILTIAYSPLDQGRIASGDDKIIRLKVIADKYNKTIAQIVLNWLISHPTVITIPKAVTPNHINENAASADFELSESDFREICNIFSSELICVPTDRIRVIMGGQGNRQVYQTAEEAVENKLGFVPGPADLANDILDGEALKPVKVMCSKDAEGRYDYDLIEGRIRYWAWVIAYNGEKPIPVCIRDN